MQKRNGNDLKQIMFSVILIPVIFVLDQLTKWLITKELVMGSSIPVIGGFLDIVYSRNRGGVFGIFQEGGVYFLIASIIALILITYIYIKLYKRGRVYRYSLSLILAGAFGNIIDRIRLGFVVDFIRLHIGEHFYWPSFNIADMSIVVGAFLLLGYTLFKKNPEKNNKIEVDVDIDTLPDN